jgi:excisionase family DNA binding protein
MISEEHEWLSTGQAAKVCSVRPDTILKWIKRGKLPAKRTAGGHYRIQREDLEPLSLTPRAPEGVRSGGPPLRCWEYLGGQAGPSEECQECIVYRSRASWCFKMVESAREIGHSLRFCQESCDECAYFQRVKGMATGVLVVTDDAEMTARLGAETSPDVNVRFARDGYEASSVIQDFRPTFVVLDHDLLKGTEAGLLSRLVEDTRVPGVRAILAVSRGKAGRVKAAYEEDIVVGVIEKPFGLDRIASVVAEFPVEVGTGN